MVVLYTYNADHASDNIHINLQRESPFMLSGMICSETIDSSIYTCCRVHKTLLCVIVLGHG